MKANIGRLFPDYVGKHRRRTATISLNTIFNLNALKMRYCCTVNVWNIIIKHSSKVLSKTNDNSNQKYIRTKLLIEWCFTQCIVYKGISKTSNSSFVYSGISERELKKLYDNYTKLFRHYECINETDLSQHVCDLKIKTLQFVYEKRLPLFTLNQKLY